MKKVGLLFGLCLLLAAWPVMGEETEDAAGAMETESERVDIKDRKLTEEELAIAKHVVENFLKMEEVPRPSGHEEKISAFFMDWAKEQGFDPVQDEVLNVVFDVPATEGYEDYPMVGLQAHMDMVCVGDSPDYDPENDPIKVIVDYDTATMTADGTSLGADDGIGCAIIMSLAQNLAPHGPLRVILTVNEEDTMAGIMNLDPATVADLPYLINVDSEVSYAVTVSTAGGVQIDVTDDEVQTKAPDGGCAMELIVSGAKGGHSGMDINKGRLNAIYATEGILKELSERDVPYEIVSFKGGTASNAIPAEAKAVIAVRSEDQENVLQTASDMEASLKEEYKNTEENLSVRAGVINAVVEEAVAPEEMRNVFAFMDGIVNGVYSMSEDIEGLVESSSNLGVITLTPEQFWASAYERSSNAEKTDEILAIDQEAIDAGGFKSVMEPSGDPWPYNPDSVLLPLTQRVYLEQNGEDIKVETLHATLECGTFAVMNPFLDMISIGPDLVDVHSTSEMIYLKTIPKTFNLLAGILAAIGEADDSVVQKSSLPDQADVMTESEDYDASFIANPWEDLTAEQLKAESGLSFGLPEGIENVIYRYLPDENLAEMQFTAGSDEFCARIQPADEPMNISGMYFDWDNEEEVHIGQSTGTIGQAKTGSEDWVELCQWYDADQGLQYSLSVYTTDIDGLDLTALAEQVYE